LDWLFAPLALLGLCLIHLLGQVFPALYRAMALQPRRRNIWQIATYHWVHGSASHLFFNILALGILSTLIVTQLQEQIVPVTILILMVAGWGTWLFSTADRVAGASGLVFGYWGFILTAAAISSEPRWTAVAALTLLFYSGLWATLGKVVKGISWSGHFWGLAGGVLTASLMLLDAH
jgi:membrane associated rhomboid family serine protease